MTHKPKEPSWELVVNAILVQMEDDEKPVGLEGRGSLSQDTINLSHLDNFDWDDDWIKGYPELLKWLEHEYEHWWEDQLYDDDGFQDWLNGNKHTVHGDAYIDDLNKRVMKLYRERITDTYTCSTCGKEASEKHPMGHPDHPIKQGYPDPDVYPDGVPKGMPTDDIQWKWHVICDECWEKAHGNRRRRRR